MEVVHQEAATLSAASFHKGHVRSTSVVPDL